MRQAPPRFPETVRVRDRIRGVSEHLLADDWGVLKKFGFDLRRRDGSWQHQHREIYDNGDGAALLPYDPGRGTVILTRQFRFPDYYHGDTGALIEACAGKLDGDDPETCARREAEEEIGYRIREVELAFASVFSSPGAVAERLWLYVGHYSEADRVSAGGGHVAEGEDIEVLELPLAEALRMVAGGAIRDAKTIMLLQYLAARVQQQT